MKSLQAEWNYLQIDLKMQKEEKKRKYQKYIIIKITWTWRNEKDKYTKNESKWHLIHSKVSFIYETLQLIQNLKFSKKLQKIILGIHLYWIWSKIFKCIHHMYHLNVM